MLRTFNATLRFGLAHIKPVEYRGLWREREEAEMKVKISQA